MENHERYEFRDYFARISIPPHISRETLAIVMGELGKLEGIYGIYVRYRPSKRNKKAFRAYFKKQLVRSYRIHQTLHGQTRRVLQAERRKRLTGVHKRRWKQVWPFNEWDLHLGYGCYIDEVKEVLSLVGRLDAVEEIVAKTLKKYPPLDAPDNYSDLFPKKSDYDRKQKDTKRRARLARRQMKQTTAPASAEDPIGSMNSGAAMKI